MSFLKSILRNAISEGISKGIRDAVGKATESVVAPKAESYANKVAETIDTAAKDLDAVNAAAVEAAMANAQTPDEAFVREWSEKLAGFPVWCFGGNDFSINESGTAPDGNHYYFFEAENTTQAELDAYVLLLRKEGFVRKFPNSDETLYKDLGGEYLVFNKTDAFGCAPVMSVGMVRTSDRSEIEI
ncbi:MAG: hypothetical protein MJ175_12175 [Clostridia bacterium]|nr:hypothetical protein [Clostridia bacterium]MCQ2433352.1 hypothetical protein [Clostridia bacterium]